MIGGHIVQPQPKRKELKRDEGTFRAAHLAMALVSRPAEH